MLINACDLMLCPIHVFQGSRAPRNIEPFLCKYGIFDIIFDIILGPPRTGCSAPRLFYTPYDTLDLYLVPMRVGH